MNKINISASLTHIVVKDKIFPSIFFEGQGHPEVKVMTSSSQGQIHIIKLGVYLNDEQSWIYTSHNPLPTDYPLPTDMVWVNGTSHYCYAILVYAIKTPT